MKKISFITLLIMFSSIVFSQKDTTIYYSVVDKVIKSTEKVFYYLKVRKVKDNNFIMEYNYKNLKDKNDDEWQEGLTYYIYKSNDSTYIYKYTIASQGKDDSLVTVFNKTDNGYIIKEYRDNKITGTGFSYLIFPLIKEGKWTYYNKKSGKITKEEIYKENQFISNKRWNDKGEEMISNVFPHAEIEPEFDGGETALTNFVNENINYSQLDRRKARSGGVYITFIIMEDGSINDITVLGGFSGTLNSEAERVVKRMEKKWKPGITNGKPVRIQYSMPIKFKLD